jgi:hypothetical protein
MHRHRPFRPESGWKGQTLAGYGSVHYRAFDHGLTTGRALKGDSCRCHWALAQHWHRERHHRLASSSSLACSTSSMAGEGAGDATALRAEGSSKARSKKASRCASVISDLGPPAHAISRDIAPARRTRPSRRSASNDHSLPIYPPVRRSRLSQPFYTNDYLFGLAPRAAACRNRDRTSHISLFARYAYTAEIRSKHYSDSDHLLDINSIPILMLII